MKKVVRIQKEGIALLECATFKLITANSVGKKSVNFGDYYENKQKRFHHLLKQLRRVFFWK